MTPALALVTTDAQPVERRAGEIRRFEDICTYIKSVEGEQRAKMGIGERRGFYVRVAFSYWVAKFGHRRCLLDQDDSRWKAVYRQLTKNNDDISEILYAIQECSKDEWRREDMGRHDLTIICRDRAHIERFANRSRAYRNNEPHPLLDRFPK